MTKPPFLKGSRRPSNERVPSGKMAMEWPARSRAVARLSVARAASRFCRSMKMKPASRRPQPGST
jgi:hypothetical protein